MLWLKETNITYTWIVATVSESVVIDKISIMSQTTYPSLPLYATISSEVGRQNTEGNIPNDPEARRNC